MLRDRIDHELKNIDDIEANFFEKGPLTIEPTSAGSFKKTNLQGTLAIGKEITDDHVLDTVRDILVQDTILTEKINRRFSSKHRQPNQGLRSGLSPFKEPYSPTRSPNLMDEEEEKQSHFSQ